MPSRQHSPYKPHRQSLQPRPRTITSFSQKRNDSITDYCRHSNCTVWGLPVLCYDRKYKESWNIIAALRPEEAEPVNNRIMFTDITLHGCWQEGNANFKKRFLLKCKFVCCIIRSLVQSYIDHTSSIYPLYCRHFQFCSSAKNAGAKRIRWA